MSMRRLPPVPSGGGDRNVRPGGGIWGHNGPHVSMGVPVGSITKVAGVRPPSGGPYCVPVPRQVQTRRAVTWSTSKAISASARATSSLSFRNEADTELDNTSANSAMSPASQLFWSCWCIGNVAQVHHGLGHCVRRQGDPSPRQLTRIKILEPGFNGRGDLPIPDCRHAGGMPNRMKRCERIDHDHVARRFPARFASSSRAPQSCWSPASAVFDPVRQMPCARRLVPILGYVRLRTFTKK